MCTITALTYPSNCDNQSGVEKAYFFDTQDVSALTFDATSREITAITMNASTYIREINFNEEEATVTQAMSEGFIQRRDQSLTFHVNGVNETVREWVQAVDSCSCLAAIVVMQSGKRLLLGIDYNSTDSTDPYRWKPKRNGAGNTESGTALDTENTNRYTRTLIWSTKYEAPFVKSTVDLTALEE